MQLVQAGDPHAFEVLFARHHGPVWRYLVRTTRDEQAASELYQETFLRVWRAASTWRPGLAFRPWLYRVAGNAARDRFRSGQREVVTQPLDPERDGRSLATPVAAVDLERALARLPDTYRDAFLLGVVEGFDHNEVALVLGISPDNARARIARARLRLRELLTEGDG
jgi:RNA polymerase sigma-70 factor (ECF subfamily)